MGDERPAAHILAMTTTIHTPATGCPTPSPAQTSSSQAASSKTLATHRPLLDHQMPAVADAVAGLANTARGVDHLRAYIAREGHANVPQKYVTDDGFKLGNWVNTRRQERRAGTLSAKRIADLSALGMVWDSLEAGYQIGVAHLLAYSAAEGHANVPGKYVTDDGFGLGTWVANRRQERGEGRLSTVRISELNTLGMVWGYSRDTGYRIGVEHLRVYIAREGHANVPQKSVTDDGFKLGVWVNSRRRDRTVGRLSAKRLAELNALGMVWDSLDAGYWIGVDHLRAYTAAQGHANVPNSHVTDDGFKLGSWVSTRRRDRKAGTLSTARIAELNTLGMVWGIHDAGYRIGVDHLRVYTAAEGHASMPASHVSDDGFKLGAWVVNRRHDHKVGRLSTARIAELDALGMVWDPRTA